MKRISLILFVLVLCFAGSIALGSADPNLVLHWAFENNLNDYSVSGITGVSYNGVGYNSEGVAGNALSSTATSCAYNAAIPTSLLPLGATDSWSVNVWVYTDAAPTDWAVAFAIGKKPYGTGGASRSLYSSSGNITFTDGDGEYLSTGIGWDVGKWQMMTVTCDGSTVKVYKNGYMIGSKTFGFADAPGELRIPSNPGWGDYFVGKFDEFKIWDKELTQTEIESLIIPDAIPGYGTPDIVAWYPLNDPNSMGVFPDQSGNGYDAPFDGYTGDITDWVVDDAVKFEGAQKLTLPATVSNLGVYSVSFWLKSGWEGWNTAFYQEVGESGSLFTIRGEVDYTNMVSMLKIYSHDYWWNNVYSLTIENANSILNSEWNHIAVVCDGVDVMLYVNGEFYASVALARSDYKQGLIGYVGYQSGQSYIGSSTTAYMSDLILWDGALNAKSITAMLSNSNMNGDTMIDQEDLKIFVEDWTAESLASAGAVITVDDFESYGSVSALDGYWSIHESQTYSGTGTLDLTSSAYEGSQALVWNYSLPVTESGGNYTSIVYQLASVTDLSGFDGASLYVNRHSGNSEEGLLFAKFFDSSGEILAESWAYTTSTPADQWDKWILDFDNLLGESGVGSVDKSVLSNVASVMIGCGSGSNDERSGVIDIDDIVVYSLPVCGESINGDIDNDCNVDIEDYAIFASDWVSVN